MKQVEAALDADRDLRGWSRTSFVGLASVACGLVCSAYVYVVTKYHGMGITPDSVTYLSCAENLMRGSGFRDFSGRLVTEFPPAYPALLALISKVLGTNTVNAARIVNVFSFGVTGYIVVTAVSVFTRSLRLALLAGFLALLGRPHIVVHVMALSEAPTIAVIVLALLYGGRLIADERAGRRTGWFRAATIGLLCGVACMMRYASIVMAFSLAVTMVILLPSGRRRILIPTIVLGAPILLLGVWCCRNLFVDGTYMGGRMAADISLQHAASEAALTLVSWLLPQDLHAGPRRALIVCILTIVGLGLVHRKLAMMPAGTASMADTLRTFAFVNAMFVCLYSVFIVISCSRIAYGLPNDKYLSPIYVGLVLYAASTLALLRASSVVGVRTAFVSGAVVAVLMVAGTGSMLSLTGEYRSLGPPGLTRITGERTELYRMSSRIGRGQNAAFVSNDPYGLWYETHIVSQIAPRVFYRSETRQQVPLEERYRDVNTLLRRNKRVYFVYFRQDDYYVPPEQWSKESVPLRAIIVNSAGGVYEVLGERD